MDLILDGCQHFTFLSLGQGCPHTKFKKNQTVPPPCQPLQCNSMYDLCSHTTPLLVMVVCEWRYGEDTTCLMCSLDCVSQQLKIPLCPRKYHMSCSYHKQERQTDVFLFGGNKQRKSKFERHVMTGLTIFHFGEQWSVQSYVSNIFSNLKTNLAYKSFRLLLKQNLYDFKICEPNQLNITRPYPLGEGLDPRLL